MSKLMEVGVAAAFRFDAFFFGELEEELHTVGDRVVFYGFLLFCTFVLLGLYGLEFFIFGRV